MTSKYTFICQTDEGDTVVTFSQEEDTWELPVEKFYNFLKGCGFIFKPEESLIVYNQHTGEERSLN